MIAKFFCMSNEYATVEFRPTQEGVNIVLFEDWAKGEHGDILAVELGVNDIQEIMEFLSDIQYELVNQMKREQDGRVD